MTATVPSGSVLPPGPYELLEAPDGTAWAARENLTSILSRELLGPLYGDTEVLPVSPHVAYLVGRLDPQQLTAEPVPVEDAPEEDRDEAGAPDADADEDVPVRRGAITPASMGLRCQVAPDQETVTVRASWGHYATRKAERAANEGAAASGRATEYVRTQVARSITITLAELTPGETRDYPVKEVEPEGVVLRVDRYDTPNSVILELALCNEADPGQGRVPVGKSLFQTQLHVEAGGAPAFLPVQDVVAEPIPPHDDDEVNRLRLQYRDRLEFAVGRTCSADWTAQPGARRASQVRTTWLPTSETPQTRARSESAVVTDMRTLATASVEELRAALTPITTGYTAWLTGLKATAATLPVYLQGEANDAIVEAEQAAGRLADGIDFLLSDGEALRCFRFMNTVMAEQRVRSEVVRRRGERPELTPAAALAEVNAEGAGAHSWRLFQLAFVLMQLPALCDPTLPQRSNPALAQVELLFFPTGGGKTEAYLGLAAFTFAIRRRRGTVASASGPLDGGDGLAVLMRYTLRLLTAQQFQRATTMVCAAELERRRDEKVWGPTPFRIGLWVGSNVSPKRVKEADEQLRAAADSGYDHGLTVLQFRRCPWCGTPITRDNIRVETVLGRVFVRCGDDFDCPFGSAGEVSEGLPVLTVDEEIYRLAPAFVIATVDKFARLAREGQAAALFGHVATVCDRHGYTHPDDSGCSLKAGSKHNASGGHPAASVRACGRLRPPDLIIQDELHLITGALGTTVGLFEAVIDTLCTWTDGQGRRVAPLIVASSATVRRAADQVRSLYGRGLAIFPPQVLDAGDTWFSSEEPISREAPGRRYLGVCATGVRLTAAEIRLSEVLLASGQELLDRHGDAADAYLTLVGYFNAIRELAGMTRYLSDDVETALGRGRPWSKLPRRRGTNYGQLNRAELTSRVSSSRITDTLDGMAVPFTAASDSTAARAAALAAVQAGKPAPERGALPYDTVLATSMLQVGVDVLRLGLMLIVGQPKNTAEYIQASSRVGRAGDRPGLVVTLGNWARPRDLAHFEQFRHYHETFYAQVEALSVTPYSLTSIERGLDGVLVSAARVLDAQAGVDGLTPEKGADLIDSSAAFVSDLVDLLVARALAASDEASADVVRARLENRVDTWKKRRAGLAAQQKRLVYERVRAGAGEGPLMISAEASTTKDLLAGAPFVVANSMREVQPEINLLVSPNPDRLYLAPPESAPAWAFPAPEED